MQKFILSILIIFFSINIILKVKKPNSSSRLNALTRGKQYIKQCTEGLLINNNINTKYTPKPKISVVIPVYNCENTLKAAVRSIQNQNMAEIEIILVNDFSEDKSYKIMQELSEEDPRIKIINNKINMGIFYTRNIGILKSKGKYIMNLDNDDLFIDKDVFDILYDEAERENVDILGFGAVDSPNYNPILTQIHNDYFHKHKDGLVVHQPELTYFPFSKNNKFHPNDYHVWGRLVKANIYIKTINNLGSNAIGEDRKLSFLCWNEDSSISVALFRFAESYKFIQKYGIFHYISKATASSTRPYDENLFSDIYLLDLIYDFTDNNFEGKKYVVEKAKEIKRAKFYNVNNEKNVLFLKAVLKKIFNCEYISERDKNYLIKEYKEILQ